LQTYSSAIIFAPKKSIIRQTFEASHVPKWITGLPKVQDSWNACLRGLECPFGSHDSIDFSLNGKRIIVGSGNYIAQLLDITTGFHLNKFRHYGFNVTKAVFSPSGDLIASASKNGRVRLCDATTGVLCSIFRGHLDRIDAAAFSPDGGVIASTSGSTVHLWNAATGEHRCILEGHTGHVYHVAFSGDSGFIVLAAGDGKVRLWSKDICVTVDVLQQLNASGHAYYVFLNCGFAGVGASGSHKHIRVLPQPTFFFSDQPGGHIKVLYRHFLHRFQGETSEVEPAIVLDLYTEMLLRAKQSLSLPDDAQETPRNVILTLRWLLLITRRIDPGLEVSVLNSTGMLGSAWLRTRGKMDVRRALGPSSVLDRAGIPAE